MYIYIIYKYITEYLIAGKTIKLIIYCHSEIHVFTSIRH